MRISWWRSRIRRVTRNGSSSKDQNGKTNYSNSTTTTSWNWTSLKDKVQIIRRGRCLVVSVAPPQISCNCNNKTNQRSAASWARRTSTWAMDFAPRSRPWCIMHSNRLGTTRAVWTMNLWMTRLARKVISSPQNSKYNNNNNWHRHNSNYYHHKHSKSNRAKWAVTIMVQNCWLYKSNLSWQ